MTAAAPAEPDNNVPPGNTLIARLSHFAATDPMRDAVVTADVSWSNAELLRRVLSQAEGLEAAGISKDSVVGIRCSDDTQHLLLSLAAIHRGATSFSIPLHETRQAQTLLAERCGATHVLDGAAPVPTSDGTHSAAMPAVGAQLLFSTSGTTGEAKLVVHQDSDLVAQAHRHIASPYERFACLASMEHNFAKRHRLYCVAAGATNVFLDAAQGSLVGQCLSLGVNVLHVSAFQAQELLAVADIGRLSGVRLKLGGSHVPLPLRQQLRKQITQSLQAGYGTTETGAIGFTDPNDSNAGESVGRALAGLDVRVVDANRKALLPGERGELAIRGDGMFRGYLDNPELTAARLDDGWFFTGDIGYLDDEQRIHLCGRADDMFMFNSINIYPQDIETQICQYPGVAEALVLPKPSAVHGNIPVAFVVFDEGSDHDLQALQAFVQEQVGLRCPRQFTAVARLPRSESGKVSRREARDLSVRHGQIRSAMIAALSEDAKVRLKPAIIDAFEHGDSDIPLDDVELDSYARMELLVMLEVDYDAVITPETFATFSSLGDISAWALSAPSQGEAPTRNRPTTRDAQEAAQQSDADARTLRFFRRVCHHCRTVAQLHKALATMEYRLTPLQQTLLRDQYLSGQLIAADVADKFHAALSAWFETIHRQMRDSGKRQPEPFVSRRIAPSVTHFAGPGSPSDKTLVVCFAGKGDRKLLMPNAVLMQYADAVRYDLLVVAEPLQEGYRHGVPLLGRNIDEVIEWLAQLQLMRDYQAVRTFGCSAGGYAAVIAGYGLGAELAVSSGGRFHAERYPRRILDRFLTTWRAVRKGRCSRTLMSYSADKTRDRVYARVIAYLTGGSLLAVEFTDANVGHLILQRLLQRGELAPYLANTIFAELDNEIVTAERTNVVLTLPAGTLRPLD